MYAIYIRSTVAGLFYQKQKDNYGFPLEIQLRFKSNGFSLIYSVFFFSTNGKYKTYVSCIKWRTGSNTKSIFGETVFH